MCITFLYINNDPQKSDYQLIIASNRDEFYRRPSKPAERWPKNPQCISGFLVSDFLMNDVSAKEYLSSTEKEKNLYNPFHLVLLEKRLKTWSLNYLGSDDTVVPCVLGDGTHGWCNGCVSTPWQKVKQGLAQFSIIMDQNKTKDSRDQIVKSLMTLLSDSSPHLPDVHLEAVTARKDLIKGLSGIFVDLKSIQYGTRTSTLVLIDNEGCGEFIEKTMREPIVPEQPVWDTQTIPFKI
ncbi:hypothetical protein LSH36_38g02001 [Paralvinella palmiformis]|uniref:Uncharacterized protein n=1 Tax=Paralvinella palmiformis TaxID=53620 RepID=A0AAD9K9J7_9ANNE|nr:hypothetical protein LSH36_38g02001 [Paralvinella palmiformis]